MRLGGLLHPDIDQDYPDINSAILDDLPNYEVDELRMVEDFLRRLMGGDLSHDERTDAWEEAGASFYFDEAEDFLGFLEEFLRYVVDERRRRFM
ncbi:MAG: hypothetical protein AAGI89_04990 [Pseudomonadota bacterium]